MAALFSTEMAGDVNDGHDDHQESDFAVDGAQRRMKIVAYPCDSGCQAADGGQQQMRKAQ